MVEEEAEDLGNCPICVETFQVGDQVFFSLFSGITTLSTTRRSSTLAALARVSTVFTLTAFKDGSRGSERSFYILTMSASSSRYIFVFMCSFLLFSLARHSTCPVCRERLGNDGGGEQEQDGGEGYNGGDRDFLDMI